MLSGLTTETTMKKKHEQQRKKPEEVMSSWSFMQTDRKMEGAQTSASERTGLKIQLSHFPDVCIILQLTLLINNMGITALAYSDCSQN